MSETEVVPFGQSHNLRSRVPESENLENSAADQGRILNQSHKKCPVCSNYFRLQGYKRHLVSCVLKKNTEGVRDILNEVGNLEHRYEQQDAVTVFFKKILNQLLWSCGLLFAALIGVIATVASIASVLVCSSLCFSGVLFSVLMVATILLTIYEKYYSSEGSNTTIQGIYLSYVRFSLKKHDIWVFLRLMWMNILCAGFWPVPCTTIPDLSNLHAPGLEMDKRVQNVFAATTCGTHERWTELTQKKCGYATAYWHKNLIIYLYGQCPLVASTFGQTNVVTCPPWLEGDPGVAHFPIPFSSSEVLASLQSIKAYAKNRGTMD